MQGGDSRACSCSSKTIDLLVHRPESQGGQTERKEKAKDGIEEAWASQKLVGVVLDGRASQQEKLALRQVQISDDVGNLRLSSFQPVGITSQAWIVVAKLQRTGPHRNKWEERRLMCSQASTYT
jgi:hypothetical protein